MPSPITKADDVDAAAAAAAEAAANDLPAVPPGAATKSGNAVPYQNVMADAPGAAPNAAVEMAAASSRAAASAAVAASIEEVAALVGVAPEPPVGTTNCIQEEAVKDEVLYGDPIFEAAEMDVLSGRGASVNSHRGNQKFRALCFAHKSLFDKANHAAKRRIATEIVSQMTNEHGTRFLKKPRNANDKGPGGETIPIPYYAMSFEQAILKSQQVMRDYKRPDRLAIREIMAQQGTARKRSRSVESTPMVDVAIPTVPEEPLVENPSGVHAHDVLSGRGAFVNGHVGNELLRKLANERKDRFDVANYTEKRQFANEIFLYVKNLNPPGRFLKRIDADRKAVMEKDGYTIVASEWEELGDEKAIHKCCQVMRDLRRADRQHREQRREERQRQKIKGYPSLADPSAAASLATSASHSDEASMELSALAEKAAVEVVDKALNGTTGVETVTAIAAGEAEETLAVAI